MRAALARVRAKRLRKARDTIWKRVLRKVRLQRLMNTLQGVWKIMRQRIVHIQKSFRRIRLYKSVMAEVNARVEVKRQERIRLEMERLERER